MTTQKWTKKFSTWQGTQATRRSTDAVCKASSESMHQKTCFAVFAAASNPIFFQCFVRGPKFGVDLSSYTEKQQVPSRFALRRRDPASNLPLAGRAPGRKHTRHQGSCIGHELAFTIGGMSIATAVYRRQIGLGIVRPLVSSQAASALSSGPKVLVAGPAALSAAAMSAPAQAVSSDVGRCAALSAPQCSVSSPVAHNSELPEHYCQEIPSHDKQVLRFLLIFLEAQGLQTVPVFINGGYVRDLLLGKEPDDLDLSICLRDCPEQVTVSGLLEKIPGFAAERNDLGIDAVKIATVLSNESKDKQLDTFKAFFTNNSGVKIEVDVMPTIGEETYEEGNRIPVRDQRGTPLQDALRRDLTIGAMLLQVELQPGSTSALRYKLLDFYAGAEDLNRKILRAPCPAHKSINEVISTTLRTPADHAICDALSLRQLPEPELLQALWWAKILIDDPLRICRALRFEAKLKGFHLHEAFWQATPFAVQALQSKVAGSRKNTEYTKIGGYGLKSAQAFYELAFTHSFGPENGLRLAPALFGGQAEKGGAKFLSDVVDFDLELFRSLAAAYKDVHDAPELMGGVLGAAVFSSKFAGSNSVLAEFMSACDGLCASNIMRDAGTVPLQASQTLAEEPVPGNSLDQGVANACGINIQELRLHVQVWETLHIFIKQVHRQQVALGMLRKVHPQKSDAISGCIATLAQLRTPIKGSLLSTPGVLSVPPALRRPVLILLDVAMRILGYTDPLETTEHLNDLFTKHPLLADALSSSVWYEDDGKTLKPEFAPPKKAKQGK